MAQRSEQALAAIVACQSRDVAAFAACMQRQGVRRLIPGAFAARSILHATWGIGPRHSAPDNAASHYFLPLGSGLAAAGCVGERQAPHRTT